LVHAEPHEFHKAFTRHYILVGLLDFDCLEMLNQLLHNPERKVFKAIVRLLILNARENFQHISSRQLLHFEHIGDLL